MGTSEEANVSVLDVNPDLEVIHDNYGGSRTFIRGKFIESISRLPDGRSVRIARDARGITVTHADGSIEFFEKDEDDRWW